MSSSLATYNRARVRARLGFEGLKPRRRTVSLIIAPAAIVGQWHSELVKHSPGLRVFRYESIKKLPKGFDAAQLADDYDIVLTTFDVRLCIRLPAHIDLNATGPSRRNGFRS